LKRKGREGKWVETAVRWVMESEAISSFVQKRSDIRFINATRGGLGLKNVLFQPLDQIPFLSSPRALYKEVAQKMAEAPRLSAPSILDLKASLERVIGHLRVLVGEVRGSRALAEVELKEEMAAAVLFYDASHLFSDWKDYLTLAIRYDLVFMEFIAQSANANA
jgi:hypothetical protein